MRRLALVLLTLLALAVPGALAASAGDPVSVLKRYYACLNNHDLEAAWQLKSPAARKSQPLAQFRQGWASCQSVGFYSPLEVVSRGDSKVVVEYVVGSQDRLGTDGLRYGHYEMRATLVQAGGRWWVDRVDARETGHEDSKVWEVDRPDLPVPALPGVVPVARGFRMGAPVAVRSRDGKETWYEQRALKRVPGVTPESVGEWYLREMPSHGWRSESGLAGGSSCLGAGFHKDGWLLQVLVHSTTWNGTEAPMDPRGTNLVFSFHREK